MGIIIDEAIKGLKVEKELTLKNATLDVFDFQEAVDKQLQYAGQLEIAITIMEKYQKIEDIVRAYYNDEYADKIDIEVIEMISEVLCDGKD